MFMINPFDNQHTHSVFYCVQHTSPKLWGRGYIIPRSIVIWTSDYFKQDVYFKSLINYFWKDKKKCFARGLVTFQPLLNIPSICPESFNSVPSAVFKILQIVFSDTLDSHSVLDLVKNTIEYSWKFHLNALSIFQIHPESNISPFPKNKSLM